ncbi:acylphosphatase [Aquimarina algicola]|uniref:acylphosphatase n=1 Tax=Aquimarina algicola TaxID=2589995 RepID=A0A504JM17_9FLAO|nr:acylphosphatase [Aquimarina algicola]TPN87500.1 acylphosphatase [Aquimarina algicola]
MTKHYNITVKGIVQGVWYRKNTLEKAKQLNINGFVMNMPNGDVYVEAEGTSKQLNDLLEWCATGPEFAQVDTVSFEESHMKSFTDFEIRH